MLIKLHSKGVAIAVVVVHWIFLCQVRCLKFYKKSYLIVCCHLVGLHERHLCC